MKTNAQGMAVELGTITQGIMQATHLENVAKYVIMIQQQVQQIEQTYNQFQNLMRMEQMAMDNLKSVSKISSYGGFMNWYNRQLYLERQSEQKLANLGVQIGGSKYTLKEITDIPEALKTQFKPDFDTLSPEERKKLWIDLGLSPANYAYVQTWKERNKQIGSYLATKFSSTTSENEVMAKRYEALNAEYEADADKPENKKISEKALLMDANKLQTEANLLQMESNELQAAKNEFDYNKAMEAQAPPNQATLSDSFNDNPYVRIVDDVEVELVD
jgi:prefoldin subunit 5